MLQEDDNFDSQVRDSSFSFSLSLPSEPPDIRNWFSSYKYESPASASDSLNDFGCSSFEGSQCEKEELDTEDRNRKKDENLGEFRNTKLIDELVVDEKIAPIGFVKCKKDNKLQNPHVNERNHDSEESKDWHGFHDLCSKKIGEQEWAESRLQNLDTEATKDVNIVKKSSKNNNEDNFQELEGNKRIGKNGKISGFLESSMVNGDSKKKTNLVSNDKENGGKEVAENGFVSTKKNRVRVENYFNKPQEFQLECSRKRGMVLSIGEKNVGERRKVLSEKTNLQHSDSRERAGKWRCPQKDKPDLGPPLKQLRLERWVHRL